jgi:hypothetical protein
MTAGIHVFTFKDGLLARLAHDLQLTLEDFEIHREGAAVTGRFRPASLRVEGVIRKDGSLDPATLSAADRAKIGSNIADEILHLDRHPEARFVGTTHGTTIEGDLTLVGVTRPVRAEVQAHGGRLRAEFTLVPSRWGIPPYRALAGAIRLQDRVVVRVDLPADPGGGTTTPERCSWTQG